jgi:hypothetical protein
VLRLVGEKERQRERGGGGGGYFTKRCLEYLVVCSVVACM